MSVRSERSIVGARVVVTGATNGIGKEIARGLVRRGAHLTLIARTESKVRRVITELSAEPGATPPEYVLADLADLTSVRAASAEIVDHFPTIDVLVNNAGVHAISGSTTPEGFDTMLTTNYLSPFLLTNSLLAPLTAAGGARIVVTASEGHRLARGVDPASLGRPQRFHLPGSFSAYGRTKLLDILFTQELARRLNGSGVTVNAFCPGLNATGLFAAIPGGALLTTGGRRLGLYRAPEQGAREGLRLILDPTLALTTGKFFTSTPGLGRLPITKARLDTALQTELWERTEALVGG